MNSLQKMILAGLALVLIVGIILFATTITDGYRTTTGTVVAYDYSGGSGSAGQLQIIDGDPKFVQTTGSGESYILVLNVDGQVSSYNVSAGTYAKAVNGQKEFKVSCTQYLCNVDE